MKIFGIISLFIGGLLFLADIFVVFGGAVVTGGVSYLMAQPGLASCVDGFITGDGERPFEELFSCLTENRPFSDVPRFYYKSVDGYLENTPIAGPGDNLLGLVPRVNRRIKADSLPILFSLFNS